MSSTTEENVQAFERLGARFAALGSMVVPDPHEVTEVRDVTYAERDGRALLLDLYLPARPAALSPAIVWLHGGGWQHGDRTMAPDLSGLFAARGYAAISIDYSLSTDAPWPAQLEDVLTAVRWIRDNALEYNIDPDAIGLLGASAGGHLAALAALRAVDTREQVQAVVDCYGPTNFLTADSQRLPDGIVHDSGMAPETKLLGGRISEVPDRAREASPVTYAGSSALPPFLILQGDADIAVPVGQSVELYEALEAAGSEATLVIVEGLNHGFTGGPELNIRPAATTTVRSTCGAVDDVPVPATWQLIERFFDAHLRSDPWGARHLTA
jgi:acetyl esterase/lipase